MPEILNTWSALEQSARTAYEQGNMPEAERLLVATWNAMQQQGAPRLNIVETVGSLGFVREQQSNLNGALECYQNLLALLQDMPNTETQVFRLLQKLSELYHTAGNYRASEEYLSRADQLKQQIAKKNPQRSATSLPSLETIDSAVDAHGRALESTPGSRQNHMLDPAPAARQNQMLESTPAARQNQMPTRAQVESREASYGQPTAKPSGVEMDSPSSEGFRNIALVRQEIPPLESLVTSREKFYLTLSIVISVIVYLCTLLFAIFYVPVFLLLSLITNGLFLGGIKSHSVRISPEQLPELDLLIKDICRAMAMEVPTVYISNGEGMLNAFATRLLSRDFVVIYSNILEMAFEKGEAEVTFVLAHELAHIKRGHTKRVWLRFPAHFVPFLATAYSRACETTCDQIAAAICPEGAKWGLVALAAGSRIYRRVSLSALYRQFEEDHGFWMWFHEILSTHPNLIKRIKNAGIAANQYDPTPAAENPATGGRRRVPRFNN